MRSAKRTPTPPPPTTIHRIKVTLLRMKPPIWRRLDIDSAATLGDLHDVIQASMGWYNSHLHQFTAGGIDYSDPIMGLDDVQDEHTARLADVAPQKGSKLRYQYDFGDDWAHEIVVEAVREPAPGTRYPVCVTGKRACPPEDCGGVWGYASLLDTLSDPLDPERDGARGMDRSPLGRRGVRSRGDQPSHDRVEVVDQPLTSHSRLVAPHRLGTRGLHSTDQPR